MTARVSNPAVLASHAGFTLDKISPICGNCSVNAYPSEVLYSVVGALRPGGRVVFFEYRAVDAAVAIKPLHKMGGWQIRREASAHGLKWECSIGSLLTEHAIVFRKPRAQMFLPMLLIIAV